MQRRPVACLVCPGTMQTAWVIPQVSGTRWVLESEGPPWAGELVQSMAEPPESLVFGKEAAEILEGPGPLCEEVPSGHGPRCSVPDSAVPPGLGEWGGGSHRVRGPYGQSTYTNASPFCCLL